MNANGTSRREVNAQQWLGHIERWRASGLSKAAFCRQESLSVARFHYWWRVIEQSASQRTQRRSHFVPVRLTEPLGGLRVQVGDVVLSCSEAVSAQQLSGWVKALRSALCTL